MRCGEAGPIFGLWGLGQASEEVLLKLRSQGQAGKKEQDVGTL